MAIKPEKCPYCKGTSKMEDGFITCRFCEGSGKDTLKRDERPLICFYCKNIGKCDRCNGSKLQKKFLIFGSKIKCKKCNGSGICSYCLDAPNGGYYVVWYINDRSKYIHGEEGKILRNTNSKIKDLQNIWEKLKNENKEIIRFEEFARYPPFNDIKISDDNNFSFIELCKNVDNELKRYEKYLKKFK